GKPTMSYAPAEHWDAVFDRLQQSGQDLDWNDQWTSAFIPILRGSHAQCILDLGCGTGNDVRRLSHAGFTVIGLDYSWYALQQAHARHVPNASFVLADMARLTVLDGAV